MRNEVVMISGANGEIGHGLIKALAKQQNKRIVALDLKPLDDDLASLCERFVQGDILDSMLLGRLVAEYEITTIYHLASILSTKAEYNPETAHKINVEGTLNLLRMGVELSTWQGTSVKFIYPSSIAVYGLPDLETKQKEGKIKEWMWCNPITMYGCNKLYCENLGQYFTAHYRQLAKDRGKHSIDFRCVRFPGLISADTIPTGGTSDYGPEMIHAAAKGEPYSCFVRPDTRIPFMAMPDAIKSLLMLESASCDTLTRSVYNVTSFSPTAQELFEMVKTAYPDAAISFDVNAPRQAIVDTWPQDCDDSAARHDWGWQPDYDMQSSFNDYLLPSIKKQYQSV